MGTQGKLADAVGYDETTVQTDAIAAATEALNTCQAGLNAANGAAGRALNFQTTANTKVGEANASAGRASDLSGEATASVASIEELIEAAETAGNAAADEARTAALGF